MRREYSVVIPSDEPQNLKACLKSLMAAQPYLEPSRIIVVTNEIKEYPLGMRIKLIHDPSPFSFSRRVNIGCAEAGTDDVFLLGDDVEMITSNGVNQLLGQASFQILAPLVRGRVGPCWQREGAAAAPEVPHVAFVAVYLPREVLGIVGPLWEGFPGYGYEDLDYCMRARQKGLSCGVSDVLVEHSQKIPSTFLKRHGAEIGEMERLAKQAFLGKHSWSGPTA